MAVEWHCIGKILYNIFIHMTVVQVTYHSQICTPSAYLAIYLKGIGSIALQGHNKNLADAKNFPEIEASDWSRAQNPGF